MKAICRDALAGQRRHPKMNLRGYAAAPMLIACSLTVVKILS
jgi:hypothetical protein